MVVVRNLLSIAEMIKKVVELKGITVCMIEEPLVENIV